MSIVLLNYLVPWASVRFGWWLQPAARNTRMVDIGGAVLLSAIYVVLIVVFSQLG